MISRNISFRARMHLRPWIIPPFRKYTQLRTTRQYPFLFPKILIPTTYIHYPPFLRQFESFVCSTDNYITWRTSLRQWPKQVAVVRLPIIIGPFHCVQPIHESDSPQWRMFWGRHGYLPHAISKIFRSRLAPIAQKNIYCTLYIPYIIYIGRYNT